MARPLRLEFEGAIYHLLARGNERRRVFRVDQDREEFLRRLQDSARRYQVSIIAFVLMENHFHLLAQTRAANLSRWMHWLGVSYTVYFNRRYRRSGHLFQGRFKSLLVEKGEYLLELSRYLHLNPVRGRRLGKGDPAERRERLRNYRWSSYRGSAGLAKAEAWLEDHMVLEELGGRSERERRLRYRRFVEEGLLREVRDPGEAVRWQLVLGRESFARKLQDRISAMTAREREKTSLRQARRVVEPGRVVELVAKHLGVSARQVRDRGSFGLAARNVAMQLVWENCGMSLREIGDYFGGLNDQAVAQRLKRARNSEADIPRQLRNEISKI